MTTTSIIFANCNMPVRFGAKSPSVFALCHFALALLMTTICITQGQSLNAFQENGLVRRIDFRDGSSLSIILPSGDLTWKNIAKDGQVTEQRISSANVKQISLVKEPSTARVARIRNLLAQLGSEDYHKRNEAQVLLTETGKEFEPIIEQYSPDDEETKWRIGKVKEHLSNITGTTNTNSTFDVMVMKDSGKQLDGELDLEEFVVQYGQTKIKVTRELVATISDQPLQADFVLSNAAGGGKRQQEYPDANGTMPQGMTFVDFEYLPNGKENSGNLDVSKAYVAKGVMFQTSIADSYVGVQEYTFGRDGNFSIATVEPTYQGVITISFCVPGNELFAAGTRYVGFNVSHVNPEGTWFEAYDAQGNLITKFTTDETGTDYLGFRSEVPIAKVVVRPNTEIDEDYAIDDLFFEKPVALLESGNPNYFSVVTRQGERLQAESVSVTDKNLVLKNLSFGVPEASVPVDDVWVMIPSRAKQKKYSLDAMNNYCYCLLKDGSIVISDLGRKKLTRFKKNSIDVNSLVAFWGIKNQLATAPTYKIKPGSAVVFGNGQYFDLETAKLGENWIESPSIAELAKKAANGDEDEDIGIDLTESKYSNSKCVFLQSPTKVDQSMGVIYTYDGERYFIGPDYYAVNVTADGVSLSKDSQTENLQWNEIQSVRLPAK